MNAPMFTHLHGAGDIATKGANLVGGDRQQTHGDKVQNHQNIANLWNAILACKGIDPSLTPLDVANMMEALKIARRYAGAHNLDDYIDGVGYAAVAGEIAERMEQEKKDQSWADAANDIHPASGAHPRYHLDVDVLAQRAVEGTERPCKLLGSMPV